MAPEPPRDLRTWVIVAIVLGAFGILVGATNVASSLVPGRDRAVSAARATSAWTEKVGLPGSEKHRQLQEEYTIKMYEAQSSLMPWRALGGAIDVLLSAGLVIGGALLLQRRDSGRKLVRAAAWGHVPYEALAIGIGCVAALRTSALQGELMRRFMEADQLPGAAGDTARDMGSAAAQVGQSMQIAFVAGLGIAVAVFCVLLARVVDKPDVRAWCAGG
jgi:hypothetical protein